MRLVRRDKYGNEITLANTNFEAEAIKMADKLNRTAQNGDTYFIAGKNEQLRYSHETVEGATITFIADKPWKLLLSLSETSLIFEDKEIIDKIIKENNIKQIVHNKGKYLIFNEGSLIICLIYNPIGITMYRVTDSYMINKLLNR